MGVIGIIHNPHSRINQRHPDLVHDLERSLGHEGLLRQSTSLELLEEIIYEFMRLKIDIVAISGGDGTLHQTLTEFVSAYADEPLPRFIILRGGTMNTVSDSINHKGDALWVLEKALSRIQTAKPFTEFEQPLVRANNKYGFIFGTGVITRFLSRYYASQERGKSLAMRMLIGMIGSALSKSGYASQIFQNSEFRVQVDGNDIDGDSFSFVLGSTIKGFPLGFKPTPRAYEQKGAFHLIVSIARPASLIPKIPALWLGRDIHHPDFQFNGPASSITIIPNGNLPWMLEAEIYEADAPIEVTVGPTITFIKP